MKTRIVERTNVDGTTDFVIQTKHWLFRWLWADAWESSWAGASCKDSFATLDEAERNLCYFDNSKPKKIVIK